MHIDVCVYGFVYICVYIWIYGSIRIYINNIDLKRHKLNKKKQHLKPEFYNQVAQNAAKKKSKI